MAQPARLTSGLLARKGQALPTGRFAHAKLGVVPPKPPAPSSEQRRRGTSVPRAARLPDPSQPAQEPGGRRVQTRDDRVALTLRLDRVRYTRLKILAARRSRSG